MVIKLTLSRKGIEQAQKELQDYKRELLEARLSTFVKRLAERGVTVAQARFASAQYDGTNDVTVRYEVDGAKATIYAEGNAVAFIEFGTGVKYPTHPSGMFSHGTYGQGKGANPNGWVYKGEPGTAGTELTDRNGKVREGVYRTKGNPPAMAMWGAVEEMSAVITSTWKEVMS